MYQKLAGMSGTAKTEEKEFSTTYNLTVYPLPTNKKLNRKDRPIQVFSCDASKYEAMVNLIKIAKHTRRPVLIGTGSISQSSWLSHLLNNSDITHYVLNAIPELAAKEAQIIGRAGEPDSVTISTNMAGRGTDIMLGGDPNRMVENELSSWLYSDLLATNDTDLSSFSQMHSLNSKISTCSSHNNESRFSEAYGFFSSAKSLFLDSKLESKVTKKDIYHLLHDALILKDLIAIKVRSMNAKIQVNTRKSIKESGIIIGNKTESLSLNQILSKILPDPIFDAHLSGCSPASISLGKAAYIMESIFVDFSKNQSDFVRKVGGLLVILDGLQEAKRLENQLKGRSGRQGMNFLFK
jgi:preprotein translocase subunit SecA